MAAGVVRLPLPCGHSRQHPLKVQTCRRHWMTGGCRPCHEQLLNGDNNQVSSPTCCVGASSEACLHVRGIGTLQLHRTYAQCGTSWAPRDAEAFPSRCDTPHAQLGQLHCNEYIQQRAEKASRHTWLGRLIICVLPHQLVLCCRRGPCLLGPTFEQQQLCTQAGAAGSAAARGCHQPAPQAAAP
jgi:hypothetical protein